MAPRTLVVGMSPTPMSRSGATEQYSSASQRLYAWMTALVCVLVLDLPEHVDVGGRVQNLGVDAIYVLLFEALFRRAASRVVVERPHTHGHRAVTDDMPLVPLHPGLAEGIGGAFDFNGARRLGRRYLSGTRWVQRSALISKCESAEIARYSFVAIGIPLIALVESVVSRRGTPVKGQRDSTRTGAGQKSTERDTEQVESARCRFHETEQHAFVVVSPDPFGPRRSKTSPCGTFIDRSSTARWPTPLREPIGPV